MKLVLFDIDGTLLKGNGAARRAFEGSLRDAFAMEPDPRVHYDGKTDPQIARELLRLAGHDDAAIDARLPEVIDGYLARLRREVAVGERHFTTLPGVDALLDALQPRRDVVLGLLTGNVESGAAIKLRCAGLDWDRFRVNAFGSDHEDRPELPRVARRRARELTGHDFDGDAIVVVGDTPADIACARSVRARTVGVATGRYPADELAGHGATATFADLTDTDAVVAAICG
ncbi:HAD family hydrolase [Roseisolibacter sp. H3M3-2]|uniref:HAD family hydrolase n=1 Tax=Roseisolibacter sp. H3M3-2 TaxID=3031323 RepID=UPI0023DC80C3|nr:HAD family hydrolase [Roseisolibacter sp. H3M3-2]MDF1505022.1 haloacid dehalogenase-like hydrolase [Roseisolibacter sp. H3M3-2]